MVSVKEKGNQRKRWSYAFLETVGKGNELFIKTACGVMGDNWDKSLDDTEMNCNANSKALCHSELSKTVKDVSYRPTIFLLEALCTHCSNSHKHVFLA